MIEPHVKVVLFGAPNVGRRTFGWLVRLDASQAARLEKRDDLGCAVSRATADRVKTRSGGAGNEKSRLGLPRAASNRAP